MVTVLAAATSCSATNADVKTELGTLPSDWEILELGNIGGFKNGVNKGSSAFGHGSPFVNLLDVFGVPAISSTEHLGLVASTSSEQSDYDLRAGDVLFVRSSVKPSGVALSTVVLSDLPRAVFSGFLIRFRDSGKLTSNFKRHCFNSAYFRRSAIAASSVSANTNISQAALKQLRLAVPASQVEQEAIGAALSDADSLIKSLEILLAKRRAIKQGVMWELLTARRRLSGYTGDWMDVPLGSLGKWVGGGTPSMSKEEYWKNGDVPWVSSADIRLGQISPDLRCITERAVTETSTRLVPAGAVVIVTRSGILRRFLPVCHLTRPVAINQDIKALVPTNAKLGGFISPLLICHNDSILASCLKAGTTVESIEMAWLKGFEVKIPPTEEEAAAVCGLLDEFDADIAALEIRLAKAQQIKQGMMHDLLTGRVRLV